MRGSRGWSTWTRRSGAGSLVSPCTVRLLRGLHSSSGRAWCEGDRRAGDGGAEATRAGATSLLCHPPFTRATLSRWYAARFGALETAPLTLARLVHPAARPPSRCALRRRARPPAQVVLAASVVTKGGKRESNRSRAGSGTRWGHGWACDRAAGRRVVSPVVELDQHDEHLADDWWPRLQRCSRGSSSACLGRGSSRCCRPSRDWCRPRQIGRAHV